MPKGLLYLKWLVTFNIVVLAWVFFRANTVDDSFYILHKIFSLNGFFYTAQAVMNPNEVFYCIFIIVAMLAGERYLGKVRDHSNPKKILLTLALAAACYFLGIFDEAQFIYFQF